MTEDRLVPVNGNAVPNRTAVDMPTGRFHLSMAGWFRRFGVFGKDVYRYAVIPLLVPASTVLVMLLMVGVTRGGRREQLLGVLNEYMPVIVTLVTCMSAYIVGLAVGGEEEESRTRTFLDMLPGHGLLHFGSKLMAGAVLCCLGFVVSVLTMPLVVHQGPAAFLPSVLDIWREANDAFAAGAFMFISTAVMVLLTGLSLGLQVKSIAGAAALGLFLQGLEFAAIANFANTAEQRICWIWGYCAAMIWLGWKALSRPRQECRRNLSEEAVQEIYETIKGPRESGRFLPPHVHILRTPGTLLLWGMLGLIGVSLMVKQREIGLVVPTFGLGLAGLLLGASAWIPEERESQRFFVYLLPVHRDQLFWRRVLGLVRWCILMWLLVWGGVLLGMTSWYDRSPLAHLNDRGGIADILRMFAVLGGLTLFAPLSLGFLGLLFRLLHRSMLVSAALSVMVGFTWWVALASTMKQAPIGNMDQWHVALMEVGWRALVCVGLPLLSSFIAFCKSPLLRQSEGLRGVFTLLLLAMLIVWGVFLIGISPSDLIAVLASLKG